MIWDEGQVGPNVQVTFATDATRGRDLGLVATLEGNISYLLRSLILKCQVPRIPILRHRDAKHVSLVFFPLVRGNDESKGIVSWVAIDNSSSMISCHTVTSTASVVSLRLFVITKFLILLQQLVAGSPAPLSLAYNAAVDAARQKILSGPQETISQWMQTKEDE